MPGLCRGLHARRYQHHALRGHLLKTGATWRRDGSLIMDFSQECFYLATLEDASWLKETIMTRAKSGALPVPSAATSGDSVEDGRQSDSQPGGCAVEESDGASPHENESYSGGDGSYDHTSRLSHRSRGCGQSRAERICPTVGCKLQHGCSWCNSDATTSAALKSSTNCLARQQPPALLPSRPKPRSNPHQGKVVFDKEAHTIDATLSRLRQGGALAMGKRNKRAR